MADIIDLQTFLDGYKKAEVILGDKKRVFREPKISDTWLKIIDLLKKYCIEWDRVEFEKILTTELPLSKQKELLDTVLTNLGLV